jgi:hypothetical protein
MFTFTQALWPVDIFSVTLVVYPLLNTILSTPYSNPPLSMLQVPFFTGHCYFKMTFIKYSYLLSNNLISNFSYKYTLLLFN